MIRDLGRIPGWGERKPQPPKTQKQMVLRRLKYAMDRALAESHTHKDPKWRARLLECHFIYVDAYIEVKEHMP